MYSNTVGNGRTCEQGNGVLGYEMAAWTVTQWVMAGHVNTAMHISVAQNTNFSPLCTINHGITQTVQALQHKPEDCGLDSR